MYLVTTAQRKEYLLVLPQHLQKRASDAVRFNISVKITSFTRLQIQQQGSISISALEVHELLLDHAVPCPNNSDVLWTLSHVLEKEINTTSKLQRISFQATVDAISPIIAVVPSDLFCLLELYDDSESMHTCVVVLKGPLPLQCHAAIQPGDTIRLHNVKRVQWKVRRELGAGLQRRVPEYVFVVTKVECIEWSITATATSAPVPPLPSTTYPLMAVDGKITKVDSKSNRIHVEGHTNSNPDGLVTCILHLSHFPMSLELQLGLREGAILRAVNLHVLPWVDPTHSHWIHLGACLRSTLCLLELATAHSPFTADQGQSNDDDDEYDDDPCLTQPHMHRRSERLHLSASWIPFQYGRIHSSYFGQALRSHLSHWNFGGDVSSVDVAKSVINVLRDHDYGTGGEMREALRRLIQKDDAVAHQAGKRNPYEEFFDHALEDDERTEGLLGCHISQVVTTRVRFPSTFSLSEIKEISHCAWNQHLVGIMGGASNFGVKGGWTTSIQLSSKFIATKHREYDGNPQKTIILLGTIQSVDDAKQPTSLADKKIQVPLSLHPTSGPKSECAVGDFSAFQLHSVVISCVCLGSSNTSENGMENSSGFSCVDLRPWSSIHSGGQNRCGSCTLIRLNGFVFVASLIVHCATFALCQTKARQLVLSKSPPPLSIAQCLLPAARGMEHGTFVGLLSRQRFKFAKIRRDNFNACTLTLSHIPSDIVGPLATNYVSSLQSLDLKLFVSISRKGTEEMLKAISQLRPAISLLEEQVALATAWWKVADSENSAPIVTGGLDELVLPTSSVGLVPRLSVPMSALVEGGHGYVRFHCDTNKLRATFERVESSQQNKSTGSNTEAVVSCLGGFKFLPGMLDRRPRRRLEGASAAGEMIASELISTPCASGVYSPTLAELHDSLCIDVRNHTQCELAPSMVRLIRNARLLSISFCRAQVECTRCFKPLVLLSDHSNHAISGVVDSIPAQLFGHKSSLPTDGKQPNEQHISEEDNPQMPEKPGSILRCPNDCPLDAAQVRWDCSGVLDDGTGQAKLYAEREAALLLLGLPSADRSTIVQGAWQTDVGLVFSRASPLRAFVKQAIKEAQQVAVQKLGAKHVKDEHVLQLLTPLARAEYVLQGHCRLLPPQTFNYFVRCKPIGAFHLNQTQVEMTTPGVKETQQAIPVHTSTYSLPPLKLTLVDCARVKDETRDTSWELVKKLGAR